MYYIVAYIPIYLKLYAQYIPITRFFFLNETKQLIYDKNIFTFSKNGLLLKALR